MGRKSSSHDCVKPSYEDFRCASVRNWNVELNVPGRHQSVA